MGIGRKRGRIIIYGKRKIHITVTEDYITSYGNLSVKFNKGDKIWDYKSLYTDI